MAGPPNGIQEQRSPGPKAPHRSGWAEPEGHVVTGLDCLIGSSPLERESPVGRGGQARSKV